MVSLRYKMMIKLEVKKLSLHYIILELGTAELLEDI